ncbi:MAG: saccharopine dehydrogenase [Flavobacteriales bacterium CG_4_9_14_3_um_filter_40_17]|nr:MAG: saccharopine dehydrogenase [Flavobacteriales bacterium CG_4_9_14_3_um_filter_40_17]
MKKLLIVGAGKSTTYLIEYLLQKSQSENLCITVGDLSIDFANRLIRGYSNAKAVFFDCLNPQDRHQHISEADLVISMLPARFHFEIAKDCLRLKKHLVTASYVNDEMKSLDGEVKKAGLVFMNEIGVDPGIDHMSAMKIINQIRQNGGKMILFESFTGGLVASESDNNLWNYKFTWNPRNVVLAGQGGAAKFIQEGTYKYIPYHQLFRRTEFLEIQGYGKFEAYANRDSLKYRSIYGLDDVLTLYRGTIRRVGFSRAWHLFVMLGMTDDSYQMENTENMSYREFTNSFLPYNPNDSVELKLRYLLKIEQDDVVWDKLLELNLFNTDKKISIKNATPAQALEKILAESWALMPKDKDMLVMYHKFGYILDGHQRQLDASMVVIGDDQIHTAMAKTVGLPVAVAALQILKGNIKNPGVQLPIFPEVYEPILAELERHGIKFIEKQMPYFGYNPDKILPV